MAEIEPLNGRIAIDMNDIEELFRINPLAHEQVKTIALQREVRARDAKIKELTEQLKEN